MTAEVTPVTLREWAAEIMVRLDADDYACLEAVMQQHPGTTRTEACRVALRNAVMPADVLLRYRRLPLFPTWMVWGPLTPLDAHQRGSRLLAQGFEVETVQVPPVKPRPLWPEEDGPEDCAECGGLGDDHDDECRYASEDEV
jgi:hypothetical protein